MNNQTTEELSKRNLDSCYFSILCLPTKVYIKENNVYVDQDEYKEMISNIKTIVKEEVESIDSHMLTHEEIERFTSEERIFGEIETKDIENTIEISKDIVNEETLLENK